MSLKIADDNVIPLTAADLRLLEREYDGEDSGDETLVDGSENPSQESFVKRERIILRNTARNQALQINAAVGEDIWKDVGRLVIKDNMAEDEAMQFNHGMELDVALSFIEIQGSRLGLSSNKNEKKRKDSVLER